MRPEILAILLIFVAFSLAEFFRTGFFHKVGQRRKDGIVEIISALSLTIVTQPFVLLCGGLLAAAFFPGQQDSLATLPILAQLGLLLLLDDMTQYWWHRLTHNVKWLYELHRPLYRRAWLSPIMWVVERLISTPATHSAHHGRHLDDGVTHYKGNYGNLLFFWDVLFGTARITRRYPEQYGVENLEPVSASHQLLWPLVRDHAATSSANPDK